ncbi:MAG: hypothetical protein ABIJ40_03315 [Bacteroidota bacterium]
MNKKDVLKIIDEEITMHKKLSEIFDTEDWWYSKKVKKEFESAITNVLERVKKKIIESKVSKDELILRK